MKLIHINSREEFVSFPSLLKHNGIYGYIVLSHTHKVQFLYLDGYAIDYKDITNEFQIIEY